MYVEGYCESHLECPPVAYMYVYIDVCVVPSPSNLYVCVCLV